MRAIDRLDALIARRALSLWNQPRDHQDLRLQVKPGHFNALEHFALQRPHLIQDVHYLQDDTTSLRHAGRKQLLQCQLQALTSLKSCKAKGTYVCASQEAICICLRGCVKQLLDSITTCDLDFAELFQDMNATNPVQTNSISWQELHLDKSRAAAVIDVESQGYGKGSHLPACIRFAQHIGLPEEAMRGQDDHVEANGKPAQEVLQRSMSEEFRQKARICMLCPSQAGQTWGHLCANFANAVSLVRTTPCMVAFQPQTSARCRSRIAGR